MDMHTPIRCTSLNHCARANYQVDYSGPLEGCLKGFEQWCRKNDALWAHLYNERTGQRIATFTQNGGLFKPVYSDE